jgi:hypothetical protein
MAYNQHPLNNSQSHYNKPALVVIALIFIGIMAFVVIKQLFPELATNLGGTSDKPITPIVSTAPQAPVATSQTQGAKLPTNGNKTQSQNISENTAVTPKTGQTAAGVSCTQKDISAGLCQQ